MHVDAFARQTLLHWSVRLPAVESPLVSSSDLHFVPIVPDCAWMHLPDEHLQLQLRSISGPNHRVSLLIRGTAKHIRLQTHDIDLSIHRTGIDSPRLRGY